MHFQFANILQTQRNMHFSLFYNAFIELHNQLNYIAFYTEGDGVRPVRMLSRIRVTKERTSQVCWDQDGTYSNDYSNTIDK